MQTLASPAPLDMAAAMAFAAMGDVIVNITYVRPLALYIRVCSALATSGPSGLVKEDGEMSFLALLA